MKTVEYLPNAKAAAEAALKDLEQAWAYYTPEVLPEMTSDEPVEGTEGYMPYYAAA